MKMTDVATLTGARVINQVGKVLQHLTGLNQMTLYGGSKISKQAFNYRIRVMKLTAEQAIHALTISEREANAN